MKPSGEELFAVSRALTPNIALLLPRQTSISQLADLARRAQPGVGGREGEEPVEVEEAYLNDRLKMMTVYYGKLASNYKESVVEAQAPTTEALATTGRKKKRRKSKKGSRKKQKTSQLDPS
jgi:hypothetical protein